MTGIREIPEEYRAKRFEYLDGDEVLVYAEPTFRSDERQRWTVRFPDDVADELGFAPHARSMETTVYYVEQWLNFFGRGVEAARAGAAVGR